MLRVAIIGAGHWGVNYVRNFLNFTNCDVLYCCDISKNRRDYVRKLWPFLSTTADYNDILAEQAIDAVIISTPAETHYEIAKQCLLKGKHVLLEKPLTLLESHGQELVDISQRSKLKLMVGHTFLFNSAVKKLKELLQEDDFGEIYYLHSTRTHLGLIRNDVNAVWDLAPHDISIFSYLIEMYPTQVSAIGMKCLGNGREDVAFINLFYPNKVIANIRVSWIDSNKMRDITIVSSRKRIVFNDLNNLETIKIYEKGITAERPIRDFGEFQYILRDGNIISPKIHLTEPLANQCQHFIECILNDQQPLTDGKDGLEVVKVLIAINKSVKQSGKPVTL